MCGTQQALRVPWPYLSVQPKTGIGPKRRDAEDAK
jgi:hypothetical protein